MIKFIGIVIVFSFLLSAMEKEVKCTQIRNFNLLTHIIDNYCEPIIDSYYEPKQDESLEKDWKYFKITSYQFTTACNPTQKNKSDEANESHTPSLLGSGEAIKPMYGLAQSVIDIPEDDVQ